MAEFPRIAADRRLEMLEPPSGPVSVVLDTDTYNEIDDQFALVYALLSPSVNLEAVYAAPFFNSRSSGPRDGMERSYEEILRIFDRLGQDPGNRVFKGSKRYLEDKNRPAESAAVDDLIRRARSSHDGPLYVLAIGAITNVASAILAAPDIIERIVVVWLGGHPWYWHTTSEFNLKQDIPASQTVFDSGVPLVQIPCKNVAEHLRTTLPEMAEYVKGRGDIGDYLYSIFEGFSTDHYAYSKVMWDISTVAYINNPAWVPTELRPSPILLESVTWGPSDPSRHLIRQAYDVNRDAVFGDLFGMLG